MGAGDIPYQIFNKDFSFCFLSNSTCTSNIHRLILPVIISVCGGMSSKKIEQKND
jgi:hypothetical protein